MTSGDGSGPDDAVLRGRSILVTGGAGSFGQALVRRCLGSGARRVVIYSRDEAKQAAMKASFSDDRLRFMIGDVRDEERILQACRGVEVVVHAAALKRIEVCESDPNEAVATNVYGTQAVARACVERGVQRAVLLSTDKAAAPNTHYGATKLAAERLWIRSNVYGAGTGTRFSATRYGNVLGSRGSVVPVWREQAKAGAITVTNPEMTRFWMTMDQAVSLVVRALAAMRGGEVFVPRIGGSTIGELASVVAPDASWLHVPMRPGEKMHETLVTEDESLHSYDYGDFVVIEPEDHSWGERPVRVGAKMHPGSYRSDLTHRIGAEDLRRMVAA